MEETRLDYRIVILSKLTIWCHCLSLVWRGPMSSEITRLDLCADSLFEVIICHGCLSPAISIGHEIILKDILPRNNVQEYRSW
jgi:hypothetical protein